MKKFILLFVLLCICLLMVVPAHAASGVDGIFDQIIGTDSGNITTKKAGSSATTLDEGNLLDKYKELATFITAILTLTSFFALFYFISKLTLTAGSHEMIRRRAIMGIATSAVGVGLMGGATVILAFFYDFFR